MGEREHHTKSVLPVQFAKHNDKGAPIFTVTLTCGIVELFLIATIFSASTYQFFYNVSLSLILALIAIIVIAALTLLGNNVNNKFEKVGNALK